MAGASSTYLKNIKPNPILMGRPRPIAPQTFAQSSPLLFPAGSSQSLMTMCPTGAITTMATTMGPSMLMHGTPSLLGGPSLMQQMSNDQSMTLLKKGNFSPTVCHSNQLIIAPAPTMMSLAPTDVLHNSMMSYTPTSLNLISAPGIFVQSQPQTQPLSITLQPVPPQSTSMIASGLPSTSTFHPHSPISISTGAAFTSVGSMPSNTSGPSLLIKADNASMNLMSDNTTKKLRHKLLMPSSSPGNVFGGNFDLDNNKKLERKKFSTSKFYATKYPSSKPIDLEKLHLYYVQNVESVKCRLCSKRFPSLEHFRTHFAEHATQRVFQCDWTECKSFFLSNYKLKRHKRCHTGERPFVCDKCDKAFSRSDKLKEHIKHCTGVVEAGGGNSGGESATPGGSSSVFSSENSSADPTSCEVSPNPDLKIKRKRRRRVALPDLPTSKLGLSTSREATLLAQNEDSAMPVKRGRKPKLNKNSPPEETVDEKNIEQSEQVEMDQLADEVAEQQDGADEEQVEAEEEEQNPFEPEIELGVGADDYHNEEEYEQELEPISEEAEEDEDAVSNLLIAMEDEANEQEARDEEEELFMDEQEVDDELNLDDGDEEGDDALVVQQPEETDE